MRERESQRRTNEWNGMENKTSTLSGTLSENALKRY